MDGAILQFFFNFKVEYIKMLESNLKTLSRFGKYRDNYVDVA